MVEKYIQVIPKEVNEKYSPLTCEAMFRFIIDSLLLKEIKIKQI